jgi:molybdopterin-synthase adenylyltransferase
MRPGFTVSRKSIRLKGRPIAGAEDRQKKIPGFDQQVFSMSHVLCIGAGGIISQIAPALCRKGIGAITVIDDDIVEVSNLNRQRFYKDDIGKLKAISLAANLKRECIVATEIRGVPVRLQDAIARRLDLSCDVAICGVDNNPARVVASRYFRAKGIPVIFAAVSLDGDHGYVFVQDKAGSCIGCMLPDIANDDRYPCPGTPAIGDILQAVGALAVYSVDTVLTKRTRNWNCRRLRLSDGAFDGSMLIPVRDTCDVSRGEIHGHELLCPESPPRKEQAQP